MTKQNPTDSDAMLVVIEAPTRTPKGVGPEHRAFECDAACDDGQIERGRSPADEGWERCSDCGGAGRYSAVGCSECGVLISAEDVRSVDNAYVYCEQCSEKLCAEGVHPIVQDAIDSIVMPRGK